MAKNQQNKPKPVQVRVERVIAAAPEAIYDLVTDITRMGEWSPETIEAEWLGGATAAAPGVKFKGKNKLGSNTWSTKPTVTAAERGSRFAFEVPGKSGPTWTYEFHAEARGTRVVESVQQPQPSPWFIRMLQRRAGVTDREANLRESMNTTLANLELAATA